MRKPLILFMILVLPSLVYAGDYKDSLIRINLFGGLGLVSGDIMQVERDKYYSTVLYDNGMVEVGKPKFSAYHYGLYFDINTFNIKEFILVGIRGMYAYNKIEQEIKTGGGIYPEKTRNTGFMNYHSIAAGPVISFLPGQLFGNEETVWYNFVFINLFATAGPLLGGTIKPVPIARKTMPDYSDIPESSEFSGMQINAGGGFGFYIDLVNIGIDIYYSRNSIETEKIIYPKVGKKTEVNETRFDLSLGVSI